MELLLELGEEGIIKFTTFLNDWWEHEDIPEDYLKARVAMIYKKGATNNIDNYRPISLISAVTNTFAAILKTRIEKRNRKRTPCHAIRI